MLGVVQIHYSASDSVVALSVPSLPSMSLSVMNAHGWMDLFPVSYRTVFFQRLACGGEGSEPTSVKPTFHYADLTVSCRHSEVCDDANGFVTW